MFELGTDESLSVGIENLIEEADEALDNLIAIFLGALQKVEADWIFLVGRVEEDDIVDPFPWHTGQNICDQVSMGIDYGHALASRDVLTDEVEEER